MYNKIGEKLRLRYSNKIQEKLSLSKAKLKPLSKPLIKKQSFSSHALFNGLNQRVGSETIRYEIITGKRVLETHTWYLSIHYRSISYLNEGKLANYVCYIMFLIWFARHRLR